MNMVKKLLSYGFKEYSPYFAKQEGCYKLVYYKSSKIMELYIENKDQMLILIGQIDGEKSLLTILNLMKYGEQYDTERSVHTNSTTSSRAL